MDGWSYHSSILTRISFWISRAIVSCLSLAGLIQTALIVGVLSDTLLVGPDEKRIMASVEKTRVMQLRRCAAAKLIQAAWRLYHFKCLIELAQRKIENHKTDKKRRRLTLFKNLTRLRENHVLDRDFSDALWQWRQIKRSTEDVDNSLDKEFRADDTAITTSHISRKLDSLENLVRRGTTYARRKKSSNDRILMADFHDCDQNCSETKCPFETTSNGRPKTVKTWMDSAKSSPATVLQRHLTVKRTVSNRISKFASTKIGTPRTPSHDKNLPDLWKRQKPTSVFINDRQKLVRSFSIAER